MHTLTLELVAAAFDNWRATKPKRSSRTPQHLWNMVGGIIDHYPHTKICQALNISGAAFKRYVLAHHKQTLGNDFILAHTPSQEPGNQCELSLTHGDKTLSIAIGDTQLPYALPLILKSL